LVFSLKKLFKGSLADASGAIRWLSVVSTIAFAAATGAALSHRYLSSDVLAYQIKYLRLSQAKRELDQKKELTALHRQLRRSRFWLGFSAWALGIAAAFLGMVILVWLFSIKF
jgi:hypothetical protein